MPAYENASVEEFRNSNWTFPDDLNDETSKYKFRDALLKSCDELEKQGNRSLAESVALIAHACSMTLKFDEPDNPYWGPHFVLEDLNSEHIGILREALNRTKSEFVISRLSDILWLRTSPREPAFAERAILANLNLARRSVEDEKMVIDGRTFSKRAIELAVEMGSKPATRKLISEALEYCMKLSDPEPNDYDRFYFFQNLVTYVDLSATQPWIDLGHKLSQEAVKQRSFRKARSYLKEVRYLQRRLKNQSEAEALWVAVTDLYILEAREMKKAGDNPMRLQQLYNKAIEAARNTKGKAEEARLLVAELVEVQKAIPATLSKIGEYVEDLEPTVQKLIPAVAQATLKNALRLVAAMARPMKKKELYQSAGESLKQNPIHAFVNQTYVDEKGKQIAYRPGFGSSADENTAALRAEATLHTSIKISRNGRLVVFTRREIYRRPDANSEIFDDILYPNPFIPGSRLGQFRIGMIHGLRGEWVAALYILIPLLENSLRHVMQLAGMTLIEFDTNTGVQREKDLNTFIYSNEFVEIFGEDMAFQLQVLLTDKTGQNLRNEIAHGLVTDGEALYSDIGPYMWALTLLLIFDFQERYRVSETADTGANVTPPSNSVDEEIQKNEPEDTIVQ